MLNVIMGMLLVFNQQLEVPKEIKGSTKDFIVLSAKTPNIEVKFIFLDAGLKQLDQNLLKDGKTIVLMAPKNGEYKVLAVSATKDGKIEGPVQTVIKVSDSDNNDNVIPDKNELKSVIDSVYGADQDEKKAEHLGKMLAGFQEVLDSSKELTTVSKLNFAVKSKVGAKLDSDALRPVRSVLSDHLKGSFGILPENSVDKSKLESVLKNIISILEGLIK